MFQFNLKTFFRRAFRTKNYFFINLLGLTIGITSALLIFTWIHFETSYDKYHAASDRIYRVCTDINMSGHNFNSSMAPPPLMNVLDQQLPEAEACTRVWTYYNLTVTKKEEGKPDKAFNEKRVIQADSNFFDVFNYKLLAGDVETALLEPLTIVITKDAAIKYFGKQAFDNGKILGNRLTLTLGGWNADCKVSAISQNTPLNTHMPFDIILSNVTDPWSKSGDWLDNTYYTYLKLKRGSDAKMVEKKIASAVKPYLEPQLEKAFSVNYIALAQKGNYWNYRLQPLTDIHLHSNFDREIQPNGKSSHLWLLGLAALFILMTACINYANLATANSIERSKEVGVKKTLGSSTTNLRLQFFTESVITTLIALALSVVFINLLLKPFANLMQSDMPLEFIGNSFSWLLIALVFLMVTFLGGVFPAFHISSFNPIDALNGKIRLNRGFFNVRKTLLTAQFSISIGLIISALIVYSQLNYFLGKTSGFDKQNVLMLADPSQKLGDKVTILINELQKQPAVMMASVCNDYPGSGGYLLPFAVRNRIENTEHIMTSFSGGFDFAKTFDMKILEGRDFSKVSDDKITDRIIINEVAKNLLGLKQPLGQHIVTRDLNDIEKKSREYEIVGVVSNFNFESLHRKIKPMIISLNKEGTFIAVRLRQGNIHDAVKAIEATWKNIAPAVPFEFSFISDQVSHLYKTELVLTRLLGILTALIILIASLGLFGLTLLLFQQRTKEVGIRKVLGASPGNIVLLLSRDFLKLIAVAFGIATPIAWWAMHQWLQEFAYRIHIGWWIFFTAALAVLTIAAFTLSLQAIKAAIANPVKSLRTE